MAIAVRETKIIQDGGATIVELYVSDTAPDEALGKIRLTVAATLPSYQGPLLAQLQREAVREAQKVLSAVEADLLQEIPGGVLATPKTR